MTGEGEEGEPPPHPSEKRHFRGAVDRARKLRREMTDAEHKVWRGLREQQLGFRRQVPIGRYIVDFASHVAKLVVELDGSRHLEAEAYDATRTAFLQSRGYTVLRFWNSEVFDNLQGVLETVTRAAPPMPTKGDGD